MSKAKVIEILEYRLPPASVQSPAQNISLFQKNSLFHYFSWKTIKAFSHLESEPQKFIFVRRFSGTDLFHSVLSKVPLICNRIEIFIGIMWAQ